MFNGFLSTLDMYTFAGGGTIANHDSALGLEVSVH